MSENMTPSGTAREPFSRVTIDLNDPDQLAAVSDYYLMTFGQRGSTRMPEAERMRRALEQFAQQFGLHSLEDAKHRGESKPLDPSEALLVGLLVGFVVLFFVLAAVVH